MRPDGNSAGLRVCGEGCWDTLDPYRLPARKTEKISLRFPRPDLSVATNDNNLITGGANQFQISTDGNNQIPQNNGNLDTIAPNPPDNTST